MMRGTDNYSPGGPGGPTDCERQIELINQSTVNIYNKRHY